jgi:3D (Asp-Asp-Asp) domain-containing protein
LKILLLLISLITFTETAYAQVMMIATDGAERPRVVKTVYSRIVDAKKFKASAYSLRGKTASGERVRYGIIAADPRVLPLHTKVYIEGMGTFVVKDTGGAIRNNRIDIWFSNRKNAIRFGRRNVQLKVIK